MAAALSTPSTGPGAAFATVAPADEQRMLLYVSYAEYVLMREALGDRATPRMTYLKGVLELMSPSRQHELWKTNIGRFVEQYAYIRDIDLRGYGSTTFHDEAKDRGAEPDECYVIGEVLGDVPQMALEVVYSSPLLDKLDVYAGLGVPELWVFRNGAFTIFELTSSTYVPRTASVFLPELDFGLLARFVVREDVTKALREFEAHLRSM
jgi:Uma2 family endonuclease